MGAAGSLFRIVRPDGFFMVGILLTVDGGGMRVTPCEAGIFSISARPKTMRLPRNL
jgi:hypothetical protein